MSNQTPNQKLLKMCKHPLLVIFMIIMFTGCQEDPLEFQPTGPFVKEDVQNSKGKKDINHEFYKELNELKSAVAKLKNFNNAVKAGYSIDATGFVPQMGHHFLKPDLVDGTFELTKPEILLFIPGKNGKWDFLGVEYIVPIADMDNIPPAPEGFTGSDDTWFVNYKDNLWTLHVWLDLENPDGMFASLNPNVPD